MTDAGPVIELGVVPGGGRRLTLAGRLTVADSGRLHRAAVELAADPAAGSVDCTRLEHVDAAAVQVLFALRRELAGRGHALDLLGVGEAVAGQLRAAGFLNPPD